MDSDLIVFAVVGFVAQLVDGALGMAYGVISTTVLLTFGVPPVVASACVHAAEVVTTGLSGLSHALFRNIDRDLFRQIVIPGMIGGVLGAYILTELPGDRIKPVIAAYLLVMGLVILRRAFRRARAAGPPRWLVPLGLTGGFLDAIGGGGWGPVVASTLVAGGTPPRFAVGSVNSAEFFVTLSVTATFIATVGLSNWKVIVALLLGGALAAPLSAYFARRMPARLLMIVVAAAIIILSVHTLVIALA